MIRYDFSGNTVLITGGTKGIGLGLTTFFLKAGAKVIATYNRDESAAEALRQQFDDDLTVIKCNAADEEAVNKLYDDLQSKNVFINILVNNAGVIKDGFLMNMKTSDWDQVINANLKSTFLNSRAVVKGMIFKKFGRIINMSSPTAILGVAGQTNYGASKGAIISFSKSLSKELARFNITVNTVCPGLIDTPMTQGLDKSTIDGLLANVAMKRLGKIDDVSNIVGFLASKEASYITGQCLCVDGGLV